MPENDNRIDVRHATCRSIIEGADEYPRLEVHGLTGSAEARLLADLIKQSKSPLAILVADQKQARKLRLKVNAGHGLTIGNLHELLAVPHLVELNIGHSLISHALFVGIEQSVRDFLEAMSGYEAG
jgi:pyridoxine 5-phosphate synthase